MAVSYRHVSGSLFALVALLHLLRALRATNIQIAASFVPLWVSWVAVVVAGTLSVWAFRGQR